MKHSLASTCGAVLLGAALLSAQAPAGGQGQSDQKPGGGDTQPSTDRAAEERQSTTRSGSSQTYTGCLSGAANGGGYTLTDIQSGSGNAGTGASAGPSTSSGVKGTSGSSAPTYTVMGGSSKADLAGMVDKRVQIVGILSAENRSGASSTTGVAASGAGAQGGATEAGQSSTARPSGHAANQTLTITSIKTVTGSCSQ
jgi:hypothetical protein